MEDVLPFLGVHRAEVKKDKKADTADAAEGQDAADTAEGQDDTE